MAPVSIVIPTNRGRRPLRGNDHLDDDDGWASYSDAESISSYSTFSSYDYFSTRDGQNQAPIFRLRGGEQDKPVYEAWNVYYYPGKREVLEGRKALGITSHNFEEVPSRTELRRQPSAQSELANLHLRAIEDFKAEHKRCWATRALRGRGKTYEQDLEERCRDAPADVRKTVTDLLFDKGKATSTPYRTRTWTVVAMREQLQDRFARLDFPEVKRHKVRFWKNPKPQEHLLYTVVIRGAETKVVPPGEDGFATFSPTSNPWVNSDNYETRRRALEERERRDAVGQKRRTLSPSFRAPSPSYRPRSPSYRPRSTSRGPRTRSVSPPSYRSSRSRYDSPPPSARYSRSDSPPPYRCSSPRTSPLPSRSPSARIRVVPRYTPTDFDETPFPPTPPESYTPPPGVSAYHRPCTFAPPPPFPAPYAGPSTSPFHPRLPCPAPHTPPLYPRGNCCLPARKPTPPTPATCPSCRTTRTPACVHHPRALPCRKPVLWHAGMSYHPPCVFCGPPPPVAPTCHPHPHPHNNIFGGASSFNRPGSSHTNYGGFGGSFGIPSSSAPRPFTTSLNPSFTPAFNTLNPSTPYPYHTPPPPAPPLPSSRPPSSWFPDSPGPMPPAPNPFSPLSTPPLTSAGGSSPVLSSRARTPVQEGQEEVGGVQVEVVRVASPGLGPVPALGVEGGVGEGVVGEGGEGEQ